MRVEIRDDLIEELIREGNNVELSINEILEFVVTILQAPCKNFETLKVEGKYGTFVLKCLKSVDHFALMKLAKEETNGNQNR